MNRASSTSFDYAAYIPCYNNGNAVMTIKKDGQTIIINKGIKALIKDLLKEFSIDINFLKQNFSECIGRKNLIPLPLGLDTILIPVKVRKTIGINDGAFAYVDLTCIKDVTGDKNAVITLTCNSEINCLETAKTVMSKMKMGTLLEESYASRMLRTYILTDAASEMYSEYNKAATKGDVILLAHEIMKLRNKIEK